MAVARMAKYGNRTTARKLTIVEPWAEPARLFRRYSRELACAIVHYTFKILSLHICPPCNRVSRKEKAVPRLRVCLETRYSVSSWCALCDRRPFRKARLYLRICIRKYLRSLQISNPCRSLYIGFMCATVGTQENFIDFRNIPAGRGMGSHMSEVFISEDVIRYE